MPGAKDASSTVEQQKSKEQCKYMAKKKKKKRIPLPMRESNC